MIQCLFIIIKLTILNFQEEIYTILDFTENINYIVGSLTIHQLAIEDIFKNIHNDKQFITINKNFLIEFIK